MEIFCNIIKVFTVTFDQFNASLLNKCINFFQNGKQKTLLTPIFWMIMQVTGTFLIYSKIYIVLRFKM